MSFEETFDDLAHGNILHAFERIGDGIMSLFKGMPPWLKTAIGILGKSATDFMSKAAEVGYEAGEASGKTGLDKMPVAVDAARNYLGDNYKDEMRGTLISLIQMFWQSKQ